MASRKKPFSPRRLRALWRKWRARIRLNVPPGARTLLGVVLIVGGVFGFLPVLGFWMIPLGLAVIAMDFSALASLWRRSRRARDGRNADDDGK